MWKNKKADFILISIFLLLIVVIFTTTVLVLGKKVKTSKSIPSSPTPTTVKILTPTLFPGPKKVVKMPWEDSVCGNGICERCESRSECCNYPCVTDPISGNQMCPPPTCLGWCEKDCQEEGGCIGQLRANWQCPENKWLKVSEGQRCCGDPSAPNLVCCAD